MPSLFHYFGCLLIAYLVFVYITFIWYKSNYAVLLDINLKQKSSMQQNSGNFTTKQRSINLQPRKFKDVANKFDKGNGSISENHDKLSILNMTFKMRHTRDNTVQEDTRDVGVLTQCLNRTYGDLSNWPKASVIIPFCDNELLTDVLHTVHSIIQRSPQELLLEVLLIDDNTKKVEFKGLLDSYCDSEFGGKVRIIRSEETLGLIRGRLLGARQARGDVIITMDAHMEVQETWLEALIYEIMRNPKIIATATLDWMTYDETRGLWSFQLGSNGFMCYFGWDMSFGFGYARPEIDSFHKSNRTAPFPAPCSIGTIWAMDKQFFTEIGELDEGMELWGGENLDLPIRVWLFGGRAVQVPCSHAAHLERAHNRDYRRSWGNHIYRNYARVIQVWFDDYQKYVYRELPDLKRIDPGNLTDRLELKKKAIHDFKWFLQNVYPELGIYDNDTFGHTLLKNLGLEQCIHLYGSPSIKMYKCINQPRKEDVWLTVDGYFRCDNKIFSVASKLGSQLHAEGATGVYNAKWLSKWIHWKGGPMMLYEEYVGATKRLCLEASVNGSESKIDLQKCDPFNSKQKWEFGFYTSDYEEFINVGLHSFNSSYHKTWLDIMLEWE